MVGTKENPYLLTNRRHFYNLAWLQYLGYFNEETEGAITKQYYFSLSNDIDCNGLALPPIGTTKYPFIGNFDGQNHTISNYTITDNYNTLHNTSHPSIIDDASKGYHTSGAETINYCSIVGTFGVIGSYNNIPSATYFSTIPSLGNLYLDEVTISTKSTQVLVGAIAGYVNAPIDNCGVHYVKFDISGNTKKIDSFNHLSDYALIGSYNKEKYTWDGDESGDNGYGTSTDIKELSTISDGDIKNSHAYPFRWESEDVVTHDGGSQNMTFYNGTDTGTGEVSYVTTTLTASTKNNNIGYFVGSDLKSAANKKANYENFYYPNTDTESYNLPYTDKDGIIHPAPSQKIKNYLAENGTYLLRISSNSFITKSEGLTNNDSYCLIENAQIGLWKGTALLPTRSIWLAPIMAGSFKFVLFNPDNKKEMAFSIKQLTRSTPGHYDTYFTSYKEVKKYEHLLSGKAYYFEYEITKEDINAGHEYVIVCDDTATAPYFAYLDLGSDGSDSPTQNALNFDFVIKEALDGKEELQKIKTYDSESKKYVANSSFTPSYLSFAISETSSSSAIFAFRRLIDNSGGVLYYSSLGSAYLTPCGSGTKKEVSSSDCNS